MKPWEFCKFELHAMAVKKEKGLKTRIVQHWYAFVFDCLMAKAVFRKMQQPILKWEIQVMHKVSYILSHTRKVM